MVTDDMVGGVRSILSLLSGVGPSSNRRLGDFHDLVLTVVLCVRGVAGDLVVMMVVVVVVEGFTD